MARRLARGVEPREGDFPSAPHFAELLDVGHLIISDHTRRWIREELALPGPTIDRANRARYLEEGGHSLEDRAAAQVEALLGRAPALIDEGRRRLLDEVMGAAARAVGMSALPAHDA
jgi:hypothetical protein